MSKLDFPSILTDSSRALMDYTASVVGYDTRQFKELINMAYQAKSPLCMRAARVADACCERNPELIRPYLAKMMKDLSGIKDMAVKRVFMHILTRHSWVDDEEAMGMLVDTLFRWMQDDSQAISVRAYSLVILENIAKQYPELKSELTAVLKETLPYWDSTGLQTLGTKTIKRLTR
ncbi:MAG: hypothetical protein PHY99_04915 [Bacteroidales bacterium]|nr:hypothetical protein [Bacteroidales bacterium]